MSGYQNLDDLLDTPESAPITAYIDNDQISFMAETGSTAAGIPTDPVDLLDLHPSEFIEQALTRLGVHWERV